jgi:hypothetical protein
MNQILALQALRTIPEPATFCVSSSWSLWSIHTA